jgi:acetate kinase
VGGRLNAASNATATTDTDITASDAAVRTLVITAREDLEIAAPPHPRSL